MSEASKPDSRIQEFLYEGETTEDLALYSAVGRVVILWGRLEYNLSVASKLLYELPDGSKLVTNGRRPYSVSEKLRFWRICFGSLPRLSAYHVEAVAFADDFERANKNRNDLLHFAWGMAPRGAPGTIPGQGLKSGTTGYVEGSLDLPLGALLDFAELVERLHLRMSRYTFAIAMEHSKPRPNY